MKVAFEFDEYKPFLDWYTVEHHIINWDDYNYFKLVFRFGPSCWLYGVKRLENQYRYEEKEIGEIFEGDLKRFVEWAKTDRGSRILDISVISSTIDIFKQVKKLI